jgi:hypothetical protein
MQLVRASFLPLLPVIFRLRLEADMTTARLRLAIATLS